MSSLSLELFEPRPREHCSDIPKVLGTELKLPVGDQSDHSWLAKSVIQCVNAKATQAISALD